MTARFLAWYTCVVLVLAALLLLFVTAAPGAVARLAALQAILAGMALFLAFVAVSLTRLPREHWGNQSVTVRCLLFVAALASSLLLLSSVG